MCWYPCQNMRDIIADICAGNMKWTFSALREMIAEISKGQPPAPITAPSAHRRSHCLVQSTMIWGRLIACIGSVYG